MVSGFARKTNPTVAEVLIGFVLMLLVVFGFIALGAWVLMLLLGVLATYFGFTAPGYWVVFAGLFVFNFIVGAFKRQGGTNE